MTVYPYDNLGAIIGENDSREISETSLPHVHAKTLQKLCGEPKSERAAGWLVFVPLSRPLCLHIVMRVPLECSIQAVDVRPQSWLQRVGVCRARKVRDAFLFGILYLAYFPFFKSSSSAPDSLVQRRPYGWG